MFLSLSYVSHLLLFLTGIVPPIVLVVSVQATVGGGGGIWGGICVGIVGLEAATNPFNTGVADENRDRFVVVTVPVTAGTAAETSNDVLLVVVFGVSWVIPPDSDPAPLELTEVPVGLAVP